MTKMTNMKAACLQIRCRRALDWSHPTFLQARQLWARLTSQLGGTARWPHPSTPQPSPSSPPSFKPEPIIRTEKTLLHPPPSPILQHKSFSFSRRRKVFSILFWPRPPPSWQLPGLKKIFSGTFKKDVETCFDTLCSNLS